MGMKRKKRAPRRRGWLLGSSATQVICISFVLLIALGTLLLTPVSYTHLTLPTTSRV